MQLMDVAYAWMGCGPLVWAAHCAWQRLFDAIGAVLASFSEDLIGRCPRVPGVCRVAGWEHVR